MASVNKEDSSLVSECMAFCQSLANQGQAISFSLSIGSIFSFSLDTMRKDVKSTGTKKKQSPSTQRRNARRRQEFLNKKQQNPSDVPQHAEVEVVSVSPSCDQCEYKAVSEKGLRQHKRMKHRPSSAYNDTDQPASTPSTPHTLRQQSRESTSLASSPLLHISREETCPNCERLLSSDHQCDNRSDIEEEMIHEKPVTSKPTPLFSMSSPEDRAMFGMLLQMNASLNNQK